MPFALGNLVPVGGQTRRAVAGSGELRDGVAAGGVALFTYRTEDAAAAVDTAGYFNGARALLAPGDIIHRVTVNASGVVQSAGTHIVMTVPATGNVDVANEQTLNTGTNSD